MIQRLLLKAAKFENRNGNIEVAKDLNSMLPGMFIEQTAAIFLELVNMFVMGFISTDATAGVGQINTVNNVLMNIFQAFAIGGTVIVGQCVGAKKIKQGKNAAFTALLLGELVSIAITLLIFLVRGNLVMLLFGRAEESVIANSLAYFQFTVLAPPFWFIYYQCCGFMRSAGDTKRPMVVSIILNVASMVFNIIFSFAMKLGVKGAALSYLLSVVLSALVSLCMVLRRGFLIRPSIGSGASMGDTVKKIVPIALPSAAENLFFNGCKVVVQVFLAGMGAAMISANAVFNSVDGMLNIPCMALYFLTVPVVSRCAGRATSKDSGNTLEKAKSEVSEGLRYIAKRCFVWCLLIALAHLVLSIPCCFIFSRDWEVIKIATGMLMIFAIGDLFQDGSYILPNGFKAVGDAKYSMVVSSITSWVIRVFGTWILGVKLGMGAYAIAITQVLDICLRSVLYKRRFKRGDWLKWMKD